MEEFIIGDLVERKSYGQDVCFRIVDIKKIGCENFYILQAVNHRLEADAFESDLVLIPESMICKYNIKMPQELSKKISEIEADRRRRSIKRFSLRDAPKQSLSGFIKPGKVLHIDGNVNSLAMCLEAYNRLNIHCTGAHITESEQPLRVEHLLESYNPDILVLTGKDGMKKNMDHEKMNDENYWNSKYFAEAVRIARKYEPDTDKLVIFAGASQSRYEELISAGANFASSPSRILIHTLDPVLICRKIAYTDNNITLSASEIIQGTISGQGGIGGIQTNGKLKRQ